MAQPDIGSIFESPGCLISTNTDGKLQVNDDVLKQVEELDGPMVVVAVAGLYRTGKSYLMNRLALSHGGDEISEGFSLGNTIESKTKGIWIWARQHPVRQGQYILLLDTEGLGCAFKGDQNHDNWIFCLATLLSSILCYNAKGAIDEDSLRKLNFITEMSKHIRANTEEPNDDDFDLFFPHFAYVIRDFHLDLELEGRTLTEDEYLEAALTLKTGDGAHAEDYNFPRHCIRKYFKQRKCFVFDFPVSDSQLMKRLESVHDSQLSKQFLEQTKQFCDYIFHKAPIKKLENGQPILGKMWSSLVVTYVESIRSGRVPCVEDAVRSMAMIQNSRLLDECVQMYRSMFNDISMPCDDQILATDHFAILKEVLAVFLDKVVLDHNNQFQEDLNGRLGKQYANYKVQNEQASLHLCKEVLAQLEEPYKQKMGDGKYMSSGGYALYKADMNYVKNEYSKLDYLGIKKKEVLLEFLEEKWKEEELVLAIDNKVTEEQRNLEVVRAATLEAERQKEVAERTLAKAQRKAEEKEQAMKENQKQLEAKMKAELENEKKHQEEVLSSRMAEHERLMREGADKRANALKKQMGDLRQRIKNVKPTAPSACIII